jgi:Flp pilus assembly protein CpaB
MNTYRARNIVVAVLLAAVAAFLTLFYVTNYKRSVQHSQNHVTVLVATRDIPAGTSGADLGSQHLMKTAQVLRGSVVPGAISDPSEIEKLVATQPTYAGEQVSTRRFSTANNLGVRAQLKGALRAIDVPGAPSQLLAGTLKDGDHVDVVGNFAVDSGQGKTNHFDRVVLRDLLVLKAPQDPGGGGKVQSQDTFSVMLAVTDSEASKLWFTVRNADSSNGGSGSSGGGWSLQLRPVTHPADSPENIESIWTLLTDGVNRGIVHKAVKGGPR